jgi:hypothetical protein
MVFMTTATDLRAVAAVRVELVLTQLLAVQETVA